MEAENYPVIIGYCYKFDRTNHLQKMARRLKIKIEILEKTQKGGVDITGWLEWFLDCLEAALVNTEKSISTVLQKAAFGDRYRLVSMNERQIKMVNLLWDGFDGKLTSSKWAKITKCSADTALRDIQDLMTKGVLRKTDEGGRSTNYELVM